LKTATDVDNQEIENNEERRRMKNIDEYDLKVIDSSMNAKTTNENENDPGNDGGDDETMSMKQDEDENELKTAAVGQEIENNEERKR
jgi:hypothetical protein